VIKVQFITAQGQRIEAQASAGQRLLEVAQAAGMPLEGTCEGQMACSTCHVLIAPDWFARLTPAGADEEDMLDLAAGVAATSRLSCQITITPDHDGLVVKIPGESRDMQRG
jgi:ferredoxin